MFPWTSNSTCPAASPCTRLSRAPSTPSGSDFHRRVYLPQDLPIRSIYSELLPVQDGGGSPSCLDTSLSAHAVLLDPTGVSSGHRPCGRLLLPSRYSTLSASGFPCHEAQSLHLRYGLGIALSTLSPCCYLHEPKTRFLVEWLVPLARAGVSPAGSARLILAHRSTWTNRRRLHRCSLRKVACALSGWRHAHFAWVGSHRRPAPDPLRRWAPTPASRRFAPSGPVS